MTKDNNKQYNPLEKVIIIALLNSKNLVNLLWNHYLAKVMDNGISLSNYKKYNNRLYF